VEFSGKYIDIRKRDMIPSPAGGNKKSPASRGSLKQVGLLVKRKELSKPALLSDLVQT
jgi:hypothetical protein